MVTFSAPTHCTPASSEVMLSSTGPAARVPPTPPTLSVPSVPADLHAVTGCTGPPRTWITWTPMHASVRTAPTGPPVCRDEAGGSPQPCRHGGQVLQNQPYGAPGWQRLWLRRAFDVKLQGVPAEQGGENGGGARYSPVACHLVVQPARPCPVLSEVSSISWGHPHQARRARPAKRQSAATRSCCPVPTQLESRATPWLPARAPAPRHHHQRT